MRKRYTRTSQHYHQMVDGIAVSIPKRGHINECCFCGARHRHKYADDETSDKRLWWTTKLVRRGRLGKKP